MAFPSSYHLACVILLFSLMPKRVVSQDPLLDPAESESVYRVLEAVNSAIPWRSLFPDDLCSSGPHGVVCDYFTVANGSNSVEVLHVTGLSFGYVSDYFPNPPCTPESTLSPLIFTFKYLRKLFFYKCFAGKTHVMPPVIPESFGSFLEELVIIENPSFVAPLSGIVGNFSHLRRLVVSATGVFGRIPDGFGGSSHLEQITLTRNRLSGEIPQDLGNLKNLRVLDLSQSGFKGRIPDSIGGLSELSKLDLSSNGFSGEIPEELKHLQKLEFLDLSYNRFSNSGIPLFLGEMPRLREVYLSGNELGGQIPEIWEKLEGILGLGLSGLGLVGNIPGSMGVFLRNLCYLGLDNNKLEGTVPQELGFMESLKEMNLENNMLKGRLPFSSEFTARIGGKLKIAGNQELCVEEEEDASSSKFRSSLGGCLKLCRKPNFPNAVLLSNGASSINQASYLVFTVLGLLLILF